MAVEIDNSRAAQGPALLAYRGLIIGQKLPSGTAAANSLHDVTSAAQVQVLAGRGSMLHRQALAWFAANKFTAVTIAVLDDPSAGVAASGSILASGTATADGTIYLYAGGDLVEVAVSSGDSATTIATAIATALGKRASGTVTFSSAGAADNVTITGTLADGTVVNVTFVGTAGAVVAGAATYSIDTGNDAAATSFAAQVNAHALVSRLVSANASSAIVTLTAVEAGTAGNAIGLTTTDAIAAAVSGALLTGGLGSASDRPIVASASSATVTVTSRHKGAAMNEYDLRVNYQDGEELPAGVSLTITPMASGTSSPTLTTLIAALGDIWFQIWAHPYTDATSLTAIENELADRFGAMRQIPGSAFCAKNASHATLTTLGNTRNSPHNSILPAYLFPRPPFELAAEVAAVAAYYGNADPARPFQTLALTWNLAPAESAQFTIQERNLLLFDGICSLRVADGGGLQIERLITTYQTSAGGAADTSYLDVTTMLTLLYGRYSFRTRIQTRYPRHKLASDGTRFGAGQAVVTPKLLKGEALMWFREMEELGLFENFEQFKADLTVERDATDPNRVNFLLPPDLINGFIVGAATLQFKL